MGSNLHAKYLSKAGGQYQVRKTEIGRNPRTSQYFEQMHKYEIEIELTEILVSILQMKDSDSIINVLSKIPIKKLPKIQTEEYDGKRISLYTLNRTEKKFSDCCMIKVYEFGKIQIYGGNYLDIEWNGDKPLKEYLHEFAEKYGKI